jgi:hypothetical protein
MSHALSVPEVPQSAQVYFLKPALLVPDAESRCYQPLVAKALGGADEALLLQQLHYRLRKPLHVKDGKPWYEGSYEDWQHREFPHWSRNRIKRTLLHLRQHAVITAERLARNTYDRTLYYTITAENQHALDTLLANLRGCTSDQNGPMDGTDLDLSYLEEGQEEKREEPLAAAAGEGENTQAALVTSEEASHAEAAIAPSEEVPASTIATPEPPPAAQAPAAPPVHGTTCTPPPLQAVSLPAPPRRKRCGWDWQRKVWRCQWRYSGKACLCKVCAHHHPDCECPPCTHQRFLDTKSHRPAAREVQPAGVVAD